MFSGEGMFDDGRVASGGGFALLEAEGRFADAKFAAGVDEEVFVGGVFKENGIAGGVEFADLEAVVDEPDVGVFARDEPTPGDAPAGTGGAAEQDLFVGGDRLPPLLFVVFAYGNQLCHRESAIVRDFAGWVREKPIALCPRSMIIHMGLDCTSLVWN